MIYNYPITKIIQQEGHISLKVQASLSTGEVSITATTNSNGKITWDITGVSNVAQGRQSSRTIYILTPISNSSMSGIVKVSLAETKRYTAAETSVNI